MKTLVMNKTTQRLKGIAIITYALTPILLVMTFLIILVSIVVDIKYLVSQPLEQISSVLVAVKDEAQAAGAAIGSAIEPLQRVGQDVNQALQTAGTLPTQVTLPDISIPSANLPVKPQVYLGSGFPPTVDIQMSNVAVEMPSIPGFTVAVPALQQVQEVLKNNLQVLGNLNALVSNIPNLDALRESYQTIAVKAQVLLRSIQSIGIRIFLLILLAAIMAVPILIQMYITPYTRWFYHQFNQGWKLLRHASTSPSS